MLPHKKMASAFTETISNKIFFCFFTVYLTGSSSHLNLAPLFSHPGKRRADDIRPYGVGRRFMHSMRARCFILQRAHFISADIQIAYRTGLPYPRPEYPYPPTV